MNKKKQNWQPLRALEGNKESHAAASNHQAASSPETKAHVLEQLAKSNDQNLLERVAENPQAYPSTLEKLSGHEAPEVRTAVAENTQTPPDVVKKLAADEHPDVRYRIAETTTTPLEILETLTVDENPYVSERAKHTLESVASLTERADAALVSEHYEQAEVLYLELVSQLEKLLGRNHIEVANAMHKLAATLAAQGREEEAVLSARRAEEMRLPELDDGAR